MSAINIVRNRKGAINLRATVLSVLTSGEFDVKLFSPCSIALYINYAAYKLIGVKTVSSTQVARVFTTLVKDGSIVRSGKRGTYLLARDKRRHNIKGDDLYVQSLGRAECGGGNG